MFLSRVEVICDVGFATIPGFGFSLFLALLFACSDEFWWFGDVQRPINSIVCPFALHKDAPKQVFAIFEVAS